MRLLLLGMALAWFALPARGAEGALLRVDYRNPSLMPAEWTLVLRPDGSGHFHAERGNAPADPQGGMEPVTIDRDVQLTGAFADRAFATVRRRGLLNGGCESHLKVAFQGWKKLTYSGPEGQGSCEFNYSKDKDIQALGDSLVAVAATIVEGERLQMLLQHDPLGLDHEMEFVTEASKDGRMQQLGSIRGILERLESDSDVMDRVRKRARELLRMTEK